MKACLTYRVMVLDSELLEINHTTKQESMLRILFCSGWMRRLWTLQEGIFAQQKLYVYFKNCAIRIPYIVDQLLVEFDHGKFSIFSEPIFYDAFAHWLAQFRMVSTSLNQASVWPN